MSSPWNQPENWSAAMPAPHGGAGLCDHGGAGMEDEWDLLRSSPDFDMEEMQGVSLPASFPPEASVYLSVTPSPANPPAFVAVPEPARNPSVPGPAPVPASPPLPSPPAERWPETADVAHLASDLYAEAQGEGLWRAVEVEETPLFTAPEEAERPLPDLRPIPAVEEQAEDGGIDPSESWAFLPDTMLQGGDGGRDLLTEALQAGARAGLLDAGSRLEAREVPADPVPAHTAPGELPDLLDAALKAGERAGLMDR